MQGKHTVLTFLLLFAPALSPCHAISGHEAGVLGYWKEPGGAVIHVESCSAGICATLVALGPSAPSRTDSRNPDRTLQRRSLCGLRIGEGFHLKSPLKADGGTLYDPKSGKTYQGAMSNNGDQLNLRGYIGVPLFGRTEKWARTAPVEACRS